MELADVAPVVIHASARGSQARELLLPRVVIESVKVGASDTVAVVKSIAPCEHADLHPSARLELTLTPIGSRWRVTRARPLLAEWQ